jgi:hypothetical protein
MSRYRVVGLVLLIACGTEVPSIKMPDAGDITDATVIGDGAGPDGRASPDARPPCIPPPPGTAPTYSELYTTYFAPGTEGHCANAGCHGGTNYTIWLCGATKDTCYTGMVGAGLISRANPTASVLADTRGSPLRWVNPAGNMPKDALKSFDEGRDAIQAWAAACAQND